VIGERYAHCAEGEIERKGEFSLRACVSRVYGHAHVSPRFMREIPREINLDVLTQGLRYSISGLMNLATNQTSDTTSDAQSNGPYFVNFNQDCT